MTIELIAEKTHVVENAISCFTDSPQGSTDRRCKSFQCCLGVTDFGIELISTSCRYAYLPKPVSQDPVNSILQFARKMCPVCGVMESMRLTVESQLINL